MAQKKTTIKSPKVSPKGKSSKGSSKGSRTVLTVTEKTELLEFLLTDLKGHSRRKIKTLLSCRQILVDDCITTQFNHPLKKGQKVIVQHSRPSKIVRDSELNILHEDDSIIVIEKDSGLLSVAVGKHEERSAQGILTEHVKDTHEGNRICVIHRLDRDTSGLMMFARSWAIRELFHSNWKKTILERKYIAVVQGRIKQNEGTIQSWLKESDGFTIRSYKTNVEGSKEAITHYKVLKKNDKYSLLEVQLETGRKNQIRVHLNQIGHPVVGDKKYGSKKNPLKRLGLHARVLSFKHPETREKLRFETAIPKEFLELMEESSKKPAVKPVAKPE